MGRTARTMLAVVGLGLVFPLALLLAYLDRLGVDDAEAQVHQPAPPPPSIVSALQTTVDPGLAGTANSLGYRVGEIERHVHSRERCRGKLAVQTATDWADDNLAPFRAISGADAYGTDPSDEAQVIGTDDTPVIAGMVRYDLHELLVTNASHSTPYKLRAVYGTGTMADAVTAGQYTEPRSPGCGGIWRPSRATPTGWRGAR